MIPPSAESKITTIPYKAGVEAWISAAPLLKQCACECEFACSAVMAIT